MTSGTEVRSAAAFLPQGIVEDVCFEVESGRIRSVKHERGELAQRRLGLLVPGMPNLHSHAFQRALVGRAEHRTIQDPSQSDSF
ncbi:MAG: formimidoylglutamate deiminase, partial [Myxococcota bacterium]